MKQVISAVLVLALALVPHGCAGETDSYVEGELGSSGDMIPNADGTASFEFRVSNERADIVVTGFSVTVIFYDGEVSPERALSTYRWSFLSEVAPNGQLLEYGVLDAKAVADLRKRYAAAGGGGADPLARAVYTYSAKIDAHVAAQGR